MKHGRAHWGQLAWGGGRAGRVIGGPCDPLKNMRLSQGMFQNIRQGMDAGREPAPGRPRSSRMAILAGTEIQI